MPSRSSRLSRLPQNIAYRSWKDGGLARWPQKGFARFGRMPAGGEGGAHRLRHQRWKDDGTCRRAAVEDGRVAPVGRTTSILPWVLARRTVNASGTGSIYGLRLVLCRTRQR